MKTFLKTLVGGALGLGALYVVGKICYEAGKEVAEIEHQLETNHPVMDESDDGVSKYGLKFPSDDLDSQTQNDVADEKEPEKTPDEQPKTSIFDRVTNGIKNTKAFAKVKKAFDKSNRQPGILSSLLTNPDGAKIEAYVRNGGVQINVKPRAA